MIFFRRMSSLVSRFKHRVLTIQGERGLLLFRLALVLAERMLIVIVLSILLASLVLACYLKTRLPPFQQLSRDMMYRSELGDR